MIVGQADLQASKNITSRKMDRRPRNRPVSNKHIRKRVLVGRRAQLGTINSYLCAIARFYVEGPVTQAPLSGLGNTVKHWNSGGDTHQVPIPQPEVQSPLPQVTHFLKSALNYIYLSHAQLTHTSALGS